MSYSKVNIQNITYFPDIILYITGRMWDVLLPSHHSIYHRMDVGCLTSLTSFSTSQAGCGMSYFPVIFLYITGWVCDVLLPSHHSLHHRVDVGYLTSQSHSLHTQRGSAMPYFPVSFTTYTGYSFLTLHILMCLSHVGFWTKKKGPNLFAVRICEKKNGKYFNLADMAWIYGNVVASLFNLIHWLVNFSDLDKIKILYHIEMFL